MRGTVGSRAQSLHEGGRGPCDFKCEVRKRISAHSVSVRAYGRRRWDPGVLSTFDGRMTSIPGQTASSGLVPDRRGDTDAPVQMEPGMQF